MQKLVPEARVAVAHGQMPEAELEKAMLAFVEGRADVLVATTIIENGLDIPRANTMIVNRADRYGLAQLYQLRGRVGRSDRRAYAYLMVPPDTVLSEIARKRLAAIREFSELGAGFRIAALDLELRGAGNLLGGEQSGHIEAVGLDLYVKLLEQTILELKGEAPREGPRARRSTCAWTCASPRSTCPRSTSACRSTSASARCATRRRSRRCARRSATATARRRPRSRASCATPRCALRAEALGVAQVDLRRGAPLAPRASPPHDARSGGAGPGPPRAGAGRGRPSTPQGVLRAAASRRGRAALDALGEVLRRAGRRPRGLPPGWPYNRLWPCLRSPLVHPATRRVALIRRCWRSRLPGPVGGGLDPTP